MNRIAMFLFLVLAACGSPESNSHHSILQKYLSEIHNMQLSAEKEFILLVPNYSCKGCKHKAITFYDKYVNNKSFKLITSDSQFKELQNAAYDSKMKMDRLDLDIGNPKLFVVDNQEIHDVFEFDAKIDLAVIEMKVDSIAASYSVENKQINSKSAIHIHSEH